MNNIFSKLRDFVGLNDPSEYEYEYEEVDGQEYQNLYQEEHTQPVQEEEPRRRRMRERVLTTESGVTMNSGMSNVIGMPGAINGMSEVVVMEPRTFEEMPQAIRALRERKSVVLNLTIMDPDQAQRAVDFVAGGTYAIDGHQERIGESIFLFTPNCVQVSTQLGAMNEVPMQQQPPAARPSRPMAPTPAWTGDQARMA
ncbi:cell division protein SepF [Oscillatoria sp. FACHB-1407]|uniref:cell division protein SepF n=1 Tax=Oscillatoria sp. FACHB-1407 TaxID=2692847 RepID=UPI001684D199|nr:cell division protein SepF [Oscillatoria sp. FACHB-1407]MBD2462965.1 cell division protein SepF [Oscillatoria sp. FACHB-1407]